MSQDDHKNLKLSQNGAASQDTDSESGIEKRAPDEEYKSAKAALDVMRQRGLIDDETYNARLSELSDAKKDL